MGGDTESESALTFRLDEHGIVWIRWPQGSHITAEMAEEGRDRLEVYNGGRKRPVIVEMVGVAGLTREARQVFTQEFAASRMALLGRSPVERVIANFALAVSRFTVPLRFFTSEQAAVEWLTRDGPDA
jgi:hypothetical protein